MTNYFLFSPYDDIEARLVTEISAAEYFLYGILNMYQSEPIHNALCARAAAGCDMQLIFDPHQQFLANPRLDELQAAGAVVYLDKHERSIQSQYLVYYPHRIATGRHLFTYTHDLIYASDALIETNIPAEDFYEADFFYHLEHSTPYEPTGL